MTQHQAIQIVVRAAKGYARGSEHCMEILQACEMVREMNKPTLNQELVEQALLREKTTCAVITES